METSAKGIYSNILSKLIFKIFDLKNVLVGSMNEVGYQIMAQKSFYPLGAFNLGLTRVTQISLCDIC